MTIICDTRQHKVKLWKDTREKFESLGCLTLSSKLPFGDYARMDNLTVAVDTKQGFEEVVGNFCSKDRDRVKKEILSAQKHGVELIFLIVDESATCLEDAKHWINLRGKVKGETLFKTLDTFRVRYGVRFEFCNPENAAESILNLLGVGNEAEG